MSQPPRAIKTVTLAGVEKVLTGIHETDDYFIHLGPESSSELAKICKLYIPENANCWDIGANIGVTVQILADHCKDGRVVAVEAGLNNFECLMKNIAQNRTPGEIVPIHAAAGAYDGQVNFLDASAYGYISPNGSPTRLLSPETLLSETGGRPVDFLKIDIEGFEYDFLKAGIEFLEKFETSVYLEFNIWCMIMYSNSRPKDFAEFLFDHFPFVYTLDRGEFGLTRHIKSDLAAMMHDIMVNRNMLTDMFVSFRDLGIQGKGVSGS